ncbi:MAG: sigma-70 family RNA polymerase sigma factor, partial [Rhizobacter sp.]|nr:sigma-70 family RNA polymerase sigma factor [Chlorobiales bacterium]
LRLTKAIATERDAPAVSEGSPRLNDRPPPEDSAASIQLPETDAAADARLPSTDAATGLTEATEDSLADAIVDMKENSDAKPDAEERSDEDVDEEIKVELPKDLPTPHDDKPTSREEDFALIDQTRDGDTQERDAAYKRLLSKYRGQIYNLVFRIVHDAGEVDDLVQESFAKAFNSLASFNKEFAFSTWLYRIATNSSIDYLRKRRLKTFSIDKPIRTKDSEYQFEIPDTTSEPDDNLMQDQRDRLVREAILQLPVKYRKVIEMRHLQERTYEEIAEELKKPLGTVKAHIFRAREMLYKMLRGKLQNF